MHHRGGFTSRISRNAHTGQTSSSALGRLLIISDDGEALSEHAEWAHDGTLVPLIDDPDLGSVAAAA